MPERTRTEPSQPGAQSQGQLPMGGWERAAQRISAEGCAHFCSAAEQLQVPHPACPLPGADVGIRMKWRAVRTGTSGVQGWAQRSTHACARRVRGSAVLALTASSLRLSALMRQVTVAIPTSRSVLDCGTKYTVGCSRRCHASHRQLTRAASCCRPMSCTFAWANASPGWCCGATLNLKRLNQRWGLHSIGCARLRAQRLTKAPVSRQSG